MSPTPEQTAEWHKEASTQYVNDGNVYIEDTPEEHYAAGYLRAKTEHLVEIAALKAQLAAATPLAQFAYDVLCDEDYTENLAMDYGFLIYDGNQYVLQSTIKATIDTLSKG